MARCGLSDHFELRVHICLDALERIAIHGRGRKRRLGPGGGDRTGQNAPGGLAQRDRFNGQRICQGKEMIQRFGDGNHPPASKRPDFPPSFSTTRSPPISIDLSIALTMS